MSELRKFDFSPEVIEEFRRSKQIPAHFYNREGQILIYKKENISLEEIDRLLRFEKQGIYYREEDHNRIHNIQEIRIIPEGLTDTKLLSEQTAQEMNRDVTEIFGDLKRTTFSSLHTNRSSNRVAKLFEDFSDQPDAMSGLVNVIELMKKERASYEVELAVKRTVVVMAMKTRGMIAQNYKDRKKMEAMVHDAMMASLFCDIGYTRMDHPDTPELTGDQMDYIRRHPLISYLMLAHEGTISRGTKRNILMHHHPLPSTIPGSNNYPTLSSLRSRLEELKGKYEKMHGYRAVAQDIEHQLKLLAKELPYEEDANILAIASEFASLTSDVPWRKAFLPSMAVRMIINNSFFTYTPRVLRDFLDNVAISLCDDKKIINEGDVIINGSRSPLGKTFFEVSMVVDVDRFQSRPEIQRFGFIKPTFEKRPKFRFLGFTAEDFQMDPRMAHYHLKTDDTRNIVYLVDRELNPDLHQRIEEMIEKNGKLTELRRRIDEATLLKRRKKEQNS